MSFIKIKPLCKRAKERVRQHGDVVRMVQTGIFNGENATLCESKEHTSFNQTKWLGWFTNKEIQIVS